MTTSGETDAPLLPRGRDDDHGTASPKCIQSSTRAAFCLRAALRPFPSWPRGGEELTGHFLLGAATHG